MMTEVPDDIKNYNIATTKRSDRLIDYFLALYFLLGIIFAFFYGTWLIAFGVGGLALAAYYGVKFLLPSSDMYQYVLGAVLGVFMAQFIYQMHGLFEMHFFAFIGSTILITYQKWKLQLPLAIFVIVHHALFSYLQNSGYGIYFTQVGYFELQVFIIHGSLATLIFLICGLWSYQLRKSNELHIGQTLEMARLQKEALLNEQSKLNEEALMVAYEKAEDARMAAEKANEAKSVFLATMSHEIRTPMNGVMGMASLLAQTKLTAEQDDYIDVIKTSSDALLTVINDILDFSKIESGNMDLDVQDFDLRICIEEVMDVFAGKAATQGVDLVYQIETMVPTNIIGDNIRLRQVLINLVGNALKFTKEGEVFVKVKLLQTDGKKVKLGFDVRDSGIGIPAEKLNRLFKAFSQVDSSTTRKYGGTGLGLAISERLIKLMGGTISVESEVGRGSNFSFTIEAVTGTEAKKLYAHFNIAGNEGKKVLIVDDNNTNLSILKAQLELWKLVPTLALSGKQALKILETNQNFQLIITDMQMPMMDGIDLARLIRQKMPLVPLILLSSVGDESRSKYPQLFNAVLTKPVKQAQLFKVIQEQLKDQPKAPSYISNAEMNSAEELSAEFAVKYPLNILVAEDNLVNQKLARLILTKLGYTPDMASHGLEAVRMLEEKEYDLILMDMRMPEMDGLEATRYIRMSNGYQPVIIAMTANALKEDKELCLGSGMNDYISKPIKIEVLIKSLAGVSVGLITATSQQPA